jgi:hypothetical protein
MLTKNAEVAVVGTLLLALLVTGASAAQSQGLHWGFEKGKEYYFTEQVQSLGETEPFRMDLMLIPEDYPSIQDPLANGSYPPWTSFHVYFTNGSPLVNGYVETLRVAVPVGNWSLLLDVFESYFASNPLPGTKTQSFRAAENNIDWGFVVEQSYSLSRQNWTIQYSFSRQDGVLTQCSEGSGSSDNETIIFALTRLPMDPQLQSILSAGVALGVVLAVIVVYARFRRH